MASNFSNSYKELDPIDQYVNGDRYTEFTLPLTDGNTVRHYENLSEAHGHFLKYHFKMVMFYDCLNFVISYFKRHIISYVI